MGDEPFDLDDECEGLMVRIQDITEALGSRNLKWAHGATETLLSEIEEAMAAEDAAEDMAEDAKNDEDDE
jgi:hypothetical protein